MSECERRDLAWRRCELFRHGQRAPVALIEPDAAHPGMWRFRLLPDGPLSDMVNLSRARDAAVGLIVARACAGALAPGPRRASPVRPTASSLAQRPSTGRPLCGGAGRRA